MNRSTFFDTPCNVNNSGNNNSKIPDVFNKDNTGYLDFAIGKSMNDGE